MQKAIADASGDELVSCGFGFFRGRHSSSFAMSLPGRWRQLCTPGSVAMTCGECFTSGTSKNNVESSRVQPAGLAFFIHAPVPPYIAREILLPFTCGGVGHLISPWRSLYSTCRPSSAPGGGSKCEGPMCGAQMAPIARALSAGAQGAGPHSSGKRRSGTGRQNGPHCRRP